MHRTDVRTRVGWLLAAPAIVLVLALAVYELTTAGSYNVDTGQLVAGTGVADRCLSDGHLSGCGLDPTRIYCMGNVCARARHYTNVGPFPLLQYLPTLGFKHLGTTPAGAVKGLIAISGVACLLLLLLAPWAARRFGRREAALLGLCLLASPLLWYSHAGFGEALVAVTLAAFTLVLLERGQPWLVAPLAFLATLTKETSFPFLIALALIAWHVRGRRPRRAEAIALGGGVALGLAATVAFNVFRYDSPFNLFYGQSLFRTPIGLRPQYFAALLVSPNGGLVWFWPAAAAVIAVALWIGVRRAGWSRALLREPAVLVAIVLAGLLVGFASWFSPFGAAAWGPRLLIPWIPALLLILVRSYRGELAEALTRRTLPAVAVWIAVALSSLGSLGALVDSGRRPHAYPGGQVDGNEIAYLAWTPDSTCPTLAIIQIDAHHYYRCSRHDAWTRSPMLATAVKDVWRNEPLTGLFYLLALAGLAVLVRRRSAALGEPAAADQVAEDERAAAVIQREL